MALGSIVDEPRMSTAKISVTPHFDYEQHQNTHRLLPITLRLMSSADTTESLLRSASSAETIQKPPRHNLDDDEASV